MKQCKVRANEKWGMRVMQRYKGNRKLLLKEMNEKIYLFTTSRCPACPAAKQYVADSGLENKIKIVIADQSVDGMALAESFEIQFVPTFVVVNDNLKQKFNLNEFKEWSA